MLACTFQYGDYASRWIVNICLLCQIWDNSR
jgi:hypothetical protein